jgi:hypothetical protein
VGPVDVVVQTPGGVRSAPTTFTYRQAPAAPVLTGVEPGDGTALVRWEPPAQIPGDPLDGTDLYVANAENGPWTLVRRSPAPDREATLPAPNGVPVWVSLVAVTRLGASSERSNALSAIPMAAPTVCGTLARNETWTAARVHVLGCAVEVPAGVTLTLEPGAIVKAASSITVRGTLDAEGTAGHAVVFTSLRDDSAGGDTNATEGAVSPAPGDWAGIVAIGHGAVLRLSHAEVGYVGGVSDGDGSGEAAAVLVSGGTADIRDSHLHDVATAGIAVIDPASAPVVRDTVVERTGLGSYPDRRQGMVAWPVVVRASTIAPDLVTGNRGTGNRRNGMLLSGTVAADGTLAPGPDHWVVGIGGGNYVPESPGIWQRAERLTIEPGVTLTLAAGLVVKAMPYRLPDAGAGSLVGRGTYAEGVTLTGWTDDTAGGDTDRGDTDWFGGDRRAGRA